MLFFIFSSPAHAEFPPPGAVGLLVPIYLDGAESGMAQMLIAPDPQDSYVEAAPVMEALKPSLAEEKFKHLEAIVTQGFLAVSDGEKFGVAMRFDEELLALVIALPPENRKEQALSARARYDLANKNLVAPSAVSAYVNLFGSQDYVESGPAPQDGKQPLRLSSDGAFNLHGAVLEGSANYIEDAEHPFQRGDTRLVYDLPDKMVRMAAGDLSYPVEGFQSFQSMAGVTLARNFDLQPYRVSEPTGRTSFFLNSPSRVDIYVNDRKVQTLQLGAGPFDVRDFPVVSGSNEIRLVITDASGRVEIKDFSIVSDAELLERGLHKFAYNLGVTSDSQEGIKHYDAGQPVLSAFHLYGVTDWLTLGANMQADADQQMGGVDATVGGLWGILRADFAGSSIGNDGSGMALQAQYQYIDPAQTGDDGTFKGASNFTLLTTYRDMHFAPLGVLLPNNLFSWDTTARYSRQLSPSLNIGVGGRYEIGRGEQDDDWTATLTLDKQMAHGLHFGANIEHRREENLGVFFHFTWAPPESRHFLSGQYDSFTHTTRTDWNYAQAERTNSIAASVGASHNADRSEALGNLTWFGNRGDVTASHDVVTSFGDGMIDGTEERSQLRFGTALAMSGGHFALSRPIAGGFAMIAPDAAIAEYPIGVNPLTGSDNELRYEAKTGVLGPAVLPELTPYMYRTVRVDASSLPPGFDPGETMYTLHPGYRSGTFIKIGSDANVLLDGTLVYEDGSPVALQAGGIRPAADGEGEAAAFFTNRQGRFRIEKLRPGEYVAELYSFPGVTLSFAIPEGAKGPTQTGALTFPAMPENNLAPSGRWQSAPPDMSPEDAAALMRDLFPAPPDTITPLEGITR